jgi:hypothetical protein
LTCFYSQTAHVLALKKALKIQPICALALLLALPLNTSGTSNSGQYDGVDWLAAGAVLQKFKVPALKQSLQP